MPSEAEMGNKHVEPVKDMGYNIELKRSSRQQPTSKVVNGLILSPQANQSPKLNDNHEIESPICRSILDRRHDLRRSAGNELAYQLKTSHNQGSGRKANKDDELVKHMSNLPAYLQREETGKDLQGKALNFGVLDWEHLEKWKFQKQRLPRAKAIPSSSGSSSSLMASESSLLSGRVQANTLAPRGKQAPLRCSHPKSSHEAYISQCGSQPQAKAIQHPDLKIGQRSNLNGKRIPRCKDKSSGRNHSEIKLERAMKKDSDQKIVSEREISSSNLRKNEAFLASKDKIISKNCERKQRMGELPSQYIRDSESCSNQHQSIVLLLPQRSSQKSCPETSQPSEHKMTFDKKLTEANRKSISEGLASGDANREDLYLETPPSCPVPVKVEVAKQSLTCAHKLELPDDALDICLPSDGTPTVLFKDKVVEDCKANGEPVSPNAIGTSRRIDRETTEPTEEKGRHPSPNRRFSFSLGRMSRSFSFKEGSALPQVTSSYPTVRSGPLKSEATEYQDNMNGNKANAHSRARSSPLRRLLDPLLRPKTANSVSSSEVVRPIKGNTDSPTSKMVNINESLRDKNHKASKVEALLQLTIKNGVPLFKLAVDNDSDILIATMKELTTPGKDDSSWVCTFYSVHEIKKKSGSWINQGNKGKSPGFGYNIVGQMRISSSHSPDMTSKSLKKQSEVRECVLYSVDLRQADQLTPEITPGQELAAIVVEIPIVNSSDCEAQCKNSEDCATKGFIQRRQENRNLFNIGENIILSSTVVILPGGVHSVPVKGVPSPLINRWKSGGSCDCGGWDVGCRLRILTTQEDQSSMLSGPSSILCSSSDRLDLFSQEGAQEDRPIFSLAPFKKGIYSVEFNTSVSLLQAFSISIAFICSQKPAYMLEVDVSSEGEVFQERALRGSNRVKSQHTVQEEVRGKYALSPPPSPVGRV